MIPIQLELSNFLSYRETAVLNFSAIHLACISGPNGAGKSSILDGITWALFGNSRSRSDDDVVNRAAQIKGDMAEVRYTFDLNGSVYRIIRRKQQSKSAQLELQIATDANSWKTLSESKLRETQAAIEQLLRMNYDTFTNASFLLQGKADEFTTKTPNKRKEILAELLGVTEWDRYKEAAAAQRKVVEGQQNLLDGRLAEIDAELAEEETRQKALSESQAEREHIVEKLKLQEQLLTQMRQRAAAIERHKMLVKNHQTTVARIQQNLQTSYATQKKRQQERSAIEGILAQEAVIQAEFIAWQTASKTVQEWQSKANHYNKLLQEKRPFELTLEKTRSRLEEEKRSLQIQAQQTETAKMEREKLAQTAADGNTRLMHLKNDLKKLAAQEETWHTARAELQQMEGERQFWQKEFEQVKKRDKEVQAASSEKTAVQKNIAEAEAILVDLTEQINAVTTQNQRHATLLAEMDTLESQQPSSRRQMEKLKERIDRLEAAQDTSECPLCGQPLSREHRDSVLAELQAEGQEMGIVYRAGQARIKQLGVEIKQLSATLKRSDRLEKEKTIQQQRLAKAEARLEDIEKTESVWQADGSGRLVELAAALADETAVSQKRAQVKELETAVQTKAKLQKELDSLQRDLSNAEARLVEIERLAHQWKEKGQPRLAEIEATLSSGDIDPKAQKEIKRLDLLIAEVGYDAAAQRAAQAKFEKLVDAPEKHQELKQAHATLKPLESSLADLAQRIDEQETNLADQQTQLADLQKELETLSAGAGNLELIEDEVFQLREAEIAAAQKMGIAEQRLAVLDDRRAQKLALLADRKAMSLRVQRLKLLEEACGRKGVQALLIEHALPEIEADANEILERLTGGEMHISFDTQRQLKSRDALAETLDIRIGDRDGERPYDNFSGGEQFRVNFAVRLALSQLLARRAGASLQTLVIDEGFGSQDPDGRQRLVEAINSIQDDFACILVITHIDELRDAFPTRIEIRKERAGSTITVI